MSKKRKKKNKL